MAIVQEFSASLLDPLYSIWRGVTTTVPGIVAAIILLLVGYLIAKLIHMIVKRALDGVKFDKWLQEKTEIKQLTGSFKFSDSLAEVAKWYTFVLFLPPAASVINLTPLAYFLLEIARWIPNVIVAAIIGLFGISAAQFVCHRITETKAKAAALLGEAAKIVLLIFTGLIVLEQIGVKIAVAESSFLIIIAGVMLGLALMVGIGFGLAFKEDARRILSDVKRKL